MASILRIVSGVEKKYMQTERALGSRLLNSLLSWDIIIIENENDKRKSKFKFRFSMPYESRRWKTEMAIAILLYEVMEKRKTKIEVPISFSMYYENKKQK